MTSLAQMSWTQSVLTFVLIGLCGLLMLVILLQRGRGGGLAGAFGGGGGSSAFGAKTGDVFTWITVIVAVVFLLMAVVANFAFDESYQPPKPVSATDVPDDLPETLPIELPAPSAPEAAPGGTATTDDDVPAAETSEGENSATDEPPATPQERSEDPSRP